MQFSERKIDEMNEKTLDRSHSTFSSLLFFFYHTFYLVNTILKTDIMIYNDKTPRVSEKFVSLDVYLAYIMNC